FCRTSMICCVRWSGVHDAGAGANDGIASLAAVSVSASCREARQATSAAFSVRKLSTGVVVGAGCGTSPPDPPSAPTSIFSPLPSPPYRRPRGSLADMSARTGEVYARSAVGGGSLLFVGRCGFWYFFHVDGFAHRYRLPSTSYRMISPCEASSFRSASTWLAVTSS